MPLYKFTTLKGYSEPDWIWGFSTTLNYKNFTVNISVDGRVGGIAHSVTDQAMWNSGVHIDSDNQWRYEEVVNGNKTFIGQGVKVVSGSADYDLTVISYVMTVYMLPMTKLFLMRHI